jgi:transcriptional regulator with XRE-family HTH domain
MSTDKISIKIGEGLKKVRLQEGMTQASVAQKAGTDANYYAKLERGEAIPSLKMLEKVAKALDVRSSDILPF